MFECGLEGISLKIVKMSQFEHIECNVVNHVDELSKSKDDESADAKSCTATPKLSETTTKGKETTSTPKIDRESNTNAANEDDKTKNDNANNGESKEIAVATKDNGNVSSCVIELKVVWFNFAAPPRAPITRKIDYTRLIK